MAKLVNRDTSDGLATGRYKPEVGGFTGMASHSRGLGSGERCQMAGVDSEYHADQGFFDRHTNRWTDDIVGAGGSVDELEFPYRNEMGARVPLGSAAMGLVQAEADRLQNHQAVTDDGRTLHEYVPEFFHSGSRELFERAADDGPTNPYTGWGFSATRRATDAAGNQLGVLDNQELHLPGPDRLPLPPGSRLARVTPQGSESAIKTFPGRP